MQNDMKGKQQKFRARSFQNPNSTGYLYIYVGREEVKNSGHCVVFLFLLTFLSLCQLKLSCCKSNIPLRSNGPQIKRILLGPFSYSIIIISSLPKNKNIKKHNKI